MEKHNYSGKFIVIEGLDGSGKSSQVDLLVNFLEEMDKDVILTKEPTVDSEAGKKIKKVLKGEIKIDPLELQKLYVEDRREHLENKVIPALETGKFVVSSRYAFSTFAYGGAEGLDVNLLIDMNKDFTLPDLTVIINVNPKSCIKRIEERGEDKEYFEKLDKLQKVNQYYKKIPQMFGNVFSVSGERPFNDVFEDIKNMVIKIL